MVLFGMFNLFSAICNQCIQIRTLFCTSTLCPFNNKNYRQHNHTLNTACITTSLSYNECIVLTLRPLVLHKSMRDFHDPNSLSVFSVTHPTLFPFPSHQPFLFSCFPISYPPKLSPFNPRKFTVMLPCKQVNFLRNLDFLSASLKVQAFSVPSNCKLYK